MRLDNRTREVIKSEVASLIGADSVVRLFGSRVDDEQRGGDIDLLIESSRAIKNRVQAECRLAVRLYIKLGGRKVDVLITDQRRRHAGQTRIPTAHAMRVRATTDPTKSRTYAAIPYGRGLMMRCFLALIQSPLPDCTGVLKPY